jgi:type I restriction enzyme S subunit
MEWKLKDLTVDGKGSYGIGAPAVPYQEDKLTYLRITDINDDGSLNFSDLKSVDAEDAEKYILKENDIVFARTGNSTGRSYFYEKQHGTFVYAGFLIKFSLDPNKVNPRILKYYTHSKPYFDWVNSFDTGATRGNINAKTYGDMEIELPSRKVQDKIVSILSSLDRKIELNNKINADLEEMAQAIFKNWFVDFEPFKDGKFVDSELGMIPEGWKVSQIADIPHILETGKRPKGGAVEKGIPSVGAEHVKGMCAYDYSKTKYITPDFAAKLKTGKIEGYELMIYKDGGKPGYFIPNFSILGEGYPFRECYLNEHVFKLDFNRDKGFNIFCYFFFKTDVIMSYFNSQGAKAAIPGINKKDVENIYILSPENEAVKEFGKFALPLFEQMLKNAVENRTLSLLRDTLLPRLMSGELEIPE